MNDTQTLHAILRNDLGSFIQRTFREINPGITFLPNWHVQAIAWHLTLCFRREIKRLIITLPPRHLKSISASVAFPAWALGLDPSLRFIGVSYAEILANKHSDDTRRVMEAKWYQDCFPGTQIVKATNSFIETTQRGSRLATSVGGSLTGLGGNFIIVDDIQKADEVNSAIKRENTIEFVTNTLLSRLDNKKADVMIVVQQRLHENDLVGYLLESGGWKHLNLPAIAEEPQKIAIGPEAVHERSPGDVLHPDHEPIEVLDQLKADIGETKFAAQYQQRPAPLGGAIIKLSWFKKYTLKERSRRGIWPDDSYIVQSWDTAYTAKETSDWTVCTTWLVWKDKYFLLDVFRERLEFPSVEQAIYTLAERWKTDIVLIETVGTGEALFQRLRRSRKLNLTSTKPTQDKATRMLAETPAIQQGLVHLPKEADWLENFEREVVNFPNGRYDDQVDSMWLFLFGARHNFHGARPPERLAYRR